MAFRTGEDQAAKFMPLLLQRRAEIQRSMEKERDMQLKLQNDRTKMIMGLGQQLASQGGSLPEGMTDQLPAEFQGIAGPMFESIKENYERQQAEATQKQETGERRRADIQTSKERQLRNEQKAINDRASRLAFFAESVESIEELGPAMTEWAERNKGKVSAGTLTDELVMLRKAAEVNIDRLARARASMQGPSEQSKQMDFKMEIARKLRAGEQPTWEDMQRAEDMEIGYRDPVALEEGREEFLLFVGDPTPANKQAIRTERQELAKTFGRVEAMWDAWKAYRAGGATGGIADTDFMQDLRRVFGTQDPNAAVFLSNHAALVLQFTKAMQGAKASDKDLAMTLVQFATLPEIRGKSGDARFMALQDRMNDISRVSGRGAAAQTDAEVIFDQLPSRVRAELMAGKLEIERAMTRMENAAPNSLADAQARKELMDTITRVGSGKAAKAARRAMKIFDETGEFSGGRSRSRNTKTDPQNLIGGN